MASSTTATGSAPRRSWARRSGRGAGASRRPRSNRDSRASGSPASSAPSSPPAWPTSRWGCRRETARGGRQPPARRRATPTAAPERLVKAIARLRRVAGAPQVDARDQRVIDVDAALHRRHISQRPHEQAGAYQQRDRERHLQHHERAARVVASRPAEGGRVLERRRDRPAPRESREGRRRGRRSASTPRGRRRAASRRHDRRTAAAETAARVRCPSTRGPRQPRRPGTPGRGSR